MIEFNFATINEWRLFAGLVALIVLVGIALLWFVLDGRHNRL